MYAATGYIMAKRSQVFCSPPASITLLYSRCFFAHWICFQLTFVTGLFAPYIAVHRYSHSPIKYKSWSDELMQNALESVSLEGNSVCRAAMEYGVPRSTLGDRVSGRTSHGAVSGPQRYLSEDEEEELGWFLLGCASVGYPNTRKEVLSLVQSQILCH